MKKCIFYLMAAATSLCVAACSNNDEIPESSQEQTTIHDSIIASIDNFASTRVAVDGLTLRWQSGDAIGVVYQTSDGEYQLVRYTYQGTSEEGAVFDSAPKNDTESTTLASSDVSKTSYALYPYPETSSWNSLLGFLTTSINRTEGHSTDEVNVAMTGVLTDGVYQFTPIGALLAITLKDHSGKVTKATLSTSQYSLSNFKYSIKSTELTCNSRSLASTESYTLNFEAADEHTLYFPLPASVTFTDLVLSLGGEDVTATYKFNSFTPQANVKYSKVAVVSTDGKAEEVDAVSQANNDLTVSDKVSVDFSGYTAEATPTLTIPLNKESGNEATTTLTLSGYESLSGVNIQTDDSENELTSAQNFNVVLKPTSDSNAVLTVNVPDSDVTVDCDDEEGYSLAKLVVNGAKTVTVNNKVTTMEVNSPIDKLTIDGAGQTMTLTYQGESGGGVLYLKGTMKLTLYNHGKSGIELQMDSFASGTLIISPAERDGDCTTINVVNGAIG